MRDDRIEIFVPDLPEPASHYVHVVRAGQMIFVSGCSALDAAGEVVGGRDVVAQTRQVFENLRKCLEAAGATFADVCKVTVFLRHGTDRESDQPRAPGVLRDDQAGEHAGGGRGILARGHPGGDRGHRGGAVRHLALGGGATGRLA